MGSPEKGLYIPNKIWRDIKFSHNAVILCIASEHYTESDGDVVGSPHFHHNLNINFFMR
ncbi:MAG: WxcM-like domain-containing protein [Flavobacteriaceae bacterium]|nr:WxcM-like domain-containing protein [Flavobacteriaceae bacterium]